MRIAVTGAGGFVGGAVARALIARGDEVSALVRPGGHAPPAKSHPVEGELDHAASLERLVDGADGVVHAAAWVHRATPRAEDRARCFAVNVGGTRALLESIERAGRTPAFVFVSTISVYGLSCVNAREDFQPRPENAYGESKAEAEALVLDATRRGAISGSIVRPCAVYGPHAPGNTRKLAALIRRGIVPLLKGGKNEKSFVHVDDLATAIVRLLDAGAAAAGRIYNVAGGAISVRALCEAYARGLGARPAYVPVPWFLASGAGALSATVSRASGGRAPDLGRMLDVFAGTATVDAGAIARDWGVTFRETARGVEEVLGPPR